MPSTVPCGVEVGDYNASMSPRQRAFYTAAFIVIAGFVTWAIVSLITRRGPSQPVTLPLPPTPLPLRVHVTGAVETPGVYDLPPGSIAADAIEAAGGTSASADVGNLNLARVLRDGDQVNVPEVPPTRDPRVTSEPAAPAATGERLNVNTATLEQLQALPGIGPALAQRILDYRTANGPFATVDALLNVSGIGPAKLDAIRELVVAQ